MQDLLICQQLDKRCRDCKDKRIASEYSWCPMICKQTGRECLYGKIERDRHDGGNQNGDQ
jgi:hypothetical protein